MRVALISDVHGNGVALDAVLADLELRPHDRIVCLGDALQGGSEPARVAEILRDRAIPTVLGNSDAFVLDGTAKENVPDSAREVAEWTREQLGKEGLDLIRGYQPTIEIDIAEGNHLLGFHGSPKSFDDVILPETTDEDLDRMLGENNAAVFAGGHTHVPWARWSNDRLYLNPGSVGVPYNRHQPQETFHMTPVAEYAILDGSRVEFCHVPFDLDVLDKVARSSGRPYGDRERAQFEPRA